MYVEYKQLNCKCNFQFEHFKSNSFFFYQCVYNHFLNFLCNVHNFTSLKYTVVYDDTFSWYLREMSGRRINTIRTYHAD